MRKKEEKARIAVVIRNFSSFGGGAEKYCVELVKRLSESFSIHVFTQKSTESLENVKFHKVPLILKKPRFINQILFSFFTMIMIRRQKINIVHSHDLVTHANIYTIHVPTIKSSFRTKNLLNKISSYLSPRILSYLWIEKKQMDTKGRKFIISVSDLLKKNILNNYNIPEHLVKNIPPGINSVNSNYGDIKSENDLFTILFVANGFERKGLYNLVESLKNVSLTRIRLLVAGGGIIDRAKIPDKLDHLDINFLGVVKDMNKIYPLADVLVHPTLGDTFGMVVLEAMQYKIPVIVSNSEFCGISGYLSEDEAIFLEDPRNPIEIGMKINLVINNKSLKSRLSRNGFNFSTKMSWEHSAKNTKKLYLDLLNDIN